MTKEPHENAYISRKLLAVGTWKHLRYTVGGGHYVIYEYDGFTFTKDKEDQKLARAMIDEDYDYMVYTGMIKEK